MALYMPASYSIDTVMPPTFLKDMFLLNSSGSVFVRQPMIQLYLTLIIGFHVVLQSFFIPGRHPFHMSKNQRTDIYIYIYMTLLMLTHDLVHLPSCFMMTSIMLYLGWSLRERQRTCTYPSTLFHFHFSFLNSFDNFFIRYSPALYL